MFLSIGRGIIMWEKVAAIFQWIALGTVMVFVIVYGVYVVHLMVSGVIDTTVPVGIRVLCLSVYITIVSTLIHFIAAERAKNRK